VTAGWACRDLKLHLELAAIAQLDLCHRDLTAGGGTAGIDISAEGQGIAVEDRSRVAHILLEFALAAVRIAFEHEGAVSAVSEDLAVLVALLLIGLTQIGLFARPAIRHLVAIRVRF